jgi:sarcosine oxidase subunit gamma
MANTSNAAQTGSGQSGIAHSSSAQPGGQPSPGQPTASRVAANHSALGQSAAGRTAFRRAPQITSSAFVRQLPPASRYILRGGPQVMTAAGSALGLTISQVACRAATNGIQAAALWLGPDEQLLIAPESADLAATLQPTLRDLPHSLVEVSHRQIALEVSGPQATNVLNAGCPLDLDLSAFPVGMCTRTVLTKAEIVLWRTDETVFHIEVWRSFASYVTELLAEVAREVDLPTPTLETDS